MQTMRNTSCRRPIPTPYREYTVPSGCPAHRFEPSGSERFALAMAYVPWQHWGQTYPLSEALQNGTLFPDLNKPLTCVEGGMKHGCK
jgi:hypothetical protein